MASVVALLGAGYALTTSRGPMPSQRDQVAAGKMVFLERCAKCHGARGEGRTGRRLVATWDPLAGYRTADQLFVYVSRTMPFDNPGSLKDQEYWDVITFLLNANAVLLPGIQVGRGNAGSVKTTK